MKSWILVCVSLVSGALGSVVVSRTMVRPAAAEPAGQREGAASASSMPGDRPRSSLQRRIDAIRAAAHADEGAEADADDAGEDVQEKGADGIEGVTAPQQADYPSEEEARARNRAAIEAARASVRAQPVDVRWAPDAEAKFADDLGELGANVAGVECRTSACVATLEWASRADAQRDSLQLVQARYQLPCDRRIFLDAAGPGEGPYRAEMLIDCESARGRDD